ncbi:bifunctional 2',3'-cyclic-nucleotide 2'-phosphodiesterase/3'-nucleotidase [Paraferrimonas haliotis]|uniref:bifunctional 2',3'-cyclic-nucleotide 2'-phosphodiesterase/3'-nucleotidase n=1 Tax=Paraferrimonas haliotis TaxID=2013866 RepID=UPI000BA99798|nr:bifunctional 2',3'-cyclic-nucleotide 2'-phosphodiesterase/3'-nucleotidase [Paraferrimonas haliotis]
MKPILTAIFLLLSLSACQPSVQVEQQPAQLQLRLLETSDIHTNLMDYNYYQDQTDPTIGLTRVASLIAAQRTQNTLLFDNGDLLQGSPMGDYMASKDPSQWTTHPAYKAMNGLGYDAGNLGNHEFNYGLEFLKQAIAGAQFPYVNANVFDAQNNEHMFSPTVVLERQFVDSNGQKRPFKVGVIGLVPPQIMVWDKQHLTGKVVAKDMVEMAKKYVGELRKQSVDAIVIIAHSGLGDPKTINLANQENAAIALAHIDGVDALLLGHSHSVFPSQAFANIDGVDIDRGTINQVPAVMPGRWGDHLGQIDIEFDWDVAQQKWLRQQSQSSSFPIYDSQSRQSIAKADSKLQQRIATEHQATIAYMQQPIGVTTQPLNSFLSLLQDDPSVQIVAQAQRAYMMQNMPVELAGLPVVSVASPLKAGGRHSTPGDAQQYVAMNAGELSYRNGADLYLYANTLVALKASGAQLKDWLECSANQFNQIDVSSTEPQSLINWNNHRTYNFDVIEGLSYQIDVTQPSRFDGNCKLVNDKAERISQLSYQDSQGNTLTGNDLMQKQFLVITNNFRAFGDKFAGANAEQVVFESGYETRQLLIDYIREQSRFNPASGEFDAWVEVKPDNNWSLKPIRSKAPLDIRFVTQDSQDAKTYIEHFSRWPMTKVGLDELGFAEYRVDLSAR